MKGTNHIITNLSTAMIVDTAIRAISYETNLSFYRDISAFMYQRFTVDSSSPFIYTTVSVFSLLLTVTLFVFGTLLPDCDQKTSLLGRILHIPVQHRTWTHTMWCVMLLSILILANPCFIWLSYGYMLHIFYDSLSKGGVCWFYPMSKYKKWASGAQVKKNHKIYLYRTGETSESILTGFIVFAGIGMLIFGIILTFQHGDLPFHAELLFAVNQG